MTRSLKWHEYRPSWSLLPVKNSPLPPFPDRLNFVHHNEKKVFLNFAAHLGHAFGFKNFMSREFNVTPLLYTLTLYIWIFFHWMTHKLTLNLENLKLLLSTTMELLGYWWPLFKCGKGRGMMIGLRERWNCQVYVGH